MNQRKSTTRRSEVPMLEETSSPSIDDLLLPHANHNYYFDVERLVDCIGIKNAKGEVIEINAPKYEIYKTLIEIVVSPVEEETQDLMLASKSMPLRPFDFKIAYNTLIKDKIIKVHE